MFPGGVLEIQEHLGDEPGVGVYLEYWEARSDARTSSLTVSDLA